MSAFKPAFDFIMRHEDAARSGKVTEDAGGRTRFGIAQKFHPELPEEFFTGPAEEALAEAERIMRDEYWTPLNLEQVESQQVASRLCDMSVNMGAHQACVLAQRAANAAIQGSGVTPLAEDGKLGLHSLAAINAIPPEKLLALLKEFGEAYYRHVAAVNPSQAVNLHGWLNRNADMPAAIVEVKQTT